LHQRVDEKKHPAGRQERAERVELRGPGRAAVALEQHEGADERDGREGDVHEQHPPPARPLGQETTEEDAGGTAETRDGRPGAEGGMRLAAGAENRRQRRQRGRGEHGGAQPCAKRAAISSDSLWARPPTSEEPANPIRPVTRTRRRPSRSATRPPRSRKPPYV